MGEKKEKLNATIDEKGLSHPDTLAASMELDEYVVKAQNEIYNNYKAKKILNDLTELIVMLYEVGVNAKEAIEIIKDRYNKTGEKMSEKSS